MRSRYSHVVPAVGLLLVGTTFLVLLFKHISYPLLWHDESDTVMFGQRVLEYGYPKVHGEKNVLYGLRGGLDQVDERFDAYTGAPWGYYYFAALGVALATSVDDFYAKTALLRLPFAVAGAVGLLVLLLGVLGSVDGGPRRRLVFATLFWALAAYSVSLILHLREARYYSLVVLLASALFAVFFRHHVFEKLGTGATAALLTLLLFLLFNTFYPAYPVFLVAMGLELLARALRDPGSPRERWQRFLVGALPLLLSLIATLPLLFYFDFLGQVRGWMDAWDTSPGAYAANLRFVLASLFRYEFLAPALAARVGVALLSRLDPDPSPSEALARRRRIAAFLGLFAFCYVVVVSRTPFIRERYFIVLSPVISLMLLLDGFTLWELLRRPSRPPRWLALPVASGVAACLVLSCWVRLPELRGRIHEVKYRYRGPLDFAIPYLKEKYDDTSELVIATNYEDPVYMYYLGSQVIVGYYGANLAHDLELQPDVIVPRMWPDQRDALELLADRARYDAKRFPVLSLKTNNFPGIWRIRGFRHRFRTQFVQQDAAKLLVLERPPRE